MPVLQIKELECRTFVPRVIGTLIVVAQRQ
ncbi:Protein of unknown function [Escherichia coli D6-113.11]|nr:Protein of unknown function [Escherichia coli D6-113.11]CDU34902.1 Protein of unknown function [Escherichia coli D6-113.11]